MSRSETNGERKTCCGINLSDYPVVIHQEVSFPAEVGIAYAVCRTECGNSVFIVDGSSQRCERCGGEMFRTATRIYVPIERSDLNELMVSVLSLVQSYGHSSREYYTSQVDHLLKTTSLINVANDDGKTPLILAASERMIHNDSGDSETVARLLAAGADISAKDKDGFDALLYSAHFGHESVVKVLVEHGADPNVMTNDRTTPLMLAAQWGYLAIARVLMDFGADPAITDEEGDTALDYAVRKGQTDVIGLLQQQTVLLPNEE